MKQTINHIFSTRAIQYSAFALILFIVVAGCGAIQMKSRWTTTPIDITSITSDLQNVLTPVEDKPAMIGILNDSNYLYIALVTNDRSIQRQILARGFTIWFDRAGGDTKQFGVRFPLGMQPGDFQRMREMWNKENERPTEDSRSSFLPPLDTLEADILGPKLGEHERVKVHDLKQVAVKIFMSDDRVQYNIRVPLTDNGPQPYAIGTSIGSTIGIGFETASLEARPKMKMGDEQSDGTGGGIGMGAGGGRRGGRGGIGSDGERPTMEKRTEPLNFWTKVQLSDGKAE